MTGDSELGKKPLHFGGTLVELDNAEKNITNVAARTTSVVEDEKSTFSSIHQLADE